MSFQPSYEQLRAIKAVSEWIKDPQRKPFFKLFGYAGTGKTTLAKLFAENIKGTVLYAAYTGKAAMVLRTKGCYKASTIHSLIYHALEDKKTGETEWVINLESPLRNAKLLIVDEVSMVNEELAQDLLLFKIPILVLGDPGQLPPVGGEGYFINGEPDFMLSEVHRQALDSPIIQMSMKIRERKELSIGKYGDSEVLRHEDVSLDTLMDMDQLIVGLNKSRGIYNKSIRDIKGITSKYPIVGDKLICLKNERKTGLLNGGIWNVDDLKMYKMSMSLTITSQDNIDPNNNTKKISTSKAFFDGTADQMDWRQRKTFSEFDYAYAITCHKSQASQWDKVMVLDESRSFKENRFKWLYTAVTRASDKVLIVV